MGRKAESGGSMMGRAVQSMLMDLVGMELRNIYALILFVKD